MADVELMPMDKYENLADVNLYGVVRVTKAFAPLIRKYKGKHFFFFFFFFVKSIHSSRSMGCTSNEMDSRYNRLIPVA